MLKKLAVVAVVVVVALGGLAWWLGLFSEAEAELSLEDTVAALGDTDTSTTVDGGTEAPDSTNSGSQNADTGTTDSGDPGTGDAAPGVDGPITELTGTWRVVAHENTMVGYRIQEVLVRVGDFTAVGRTHVVSGEVVAEGLTITEATMVADLSTLRSDNSTRDGQLRRQALETDRFPEGTFVLTEPITLAELPAEGEAVTVPATGDLTLHGVTQTVEIPIQGTIVGDTLVLVGSLDILLSDFGINPPSAQSVVSVEDRATMEFSLILQR